jgi:predicted ester cyclase
MGVEENKALVTRWFEEAMPELIRNPGRVDELVGEYHHEDLRTRTPHHHHHTEAGLEGLRNELRNTAAAFPDVEGIVVDEILAEGDMVAAHWTLKESPTSGEGVLRHVGQVDTGGRPMEMSGIAMYRIVDGKIVESWHYTNVIDVLLKHGVVTLEPAAAAGG